MRTPEDLKGSGSNFTARWSAYDFMICSGQDELKRALASINYHGYDIVTVTQTADKYTVFFRRAVG